MLGSRAAPHSHYITRTLPFPRQLLRVVVVRDVLVPNRMERQHRPSGQRVVSHFEGDPSSFPHLHGHPVCLVTRRQAKTSKPRLALLIPVPRPDMSSGRGEGASWIGILPASEQKLASQPVSGSPPRSLSSPRSRPDKTLEVPFFSVKFLSLLGR